MTKKELKPWLAKTMKKVKNKEDFVHYIHSFEYGIYVCLAIKFGMKTFMSWSESNKELFYHFVREWLISKGVAENFILPDKPEYQATMYKDGCLELLAELAFNNDYSFIQISED